MPRTTITRRTPAFTPMLPTPFLPSPRFPSLTTAAEDFVTRANDMIRAAFAGAPALAEVEWYPVVNVSETKDEFTLTAELPGLTAKDVSIDYCDGVLTLRGEKREAQEASEEDDRKWHVWERRFGSFQRGLPFPGGIAGDRITADFRDGVLTVHLPKLEEARARHHPIAIREG
jgi:HSP20 family protein